MPWAGEDASDGEGEVDDTRELLSLWMVACRGPARGAHRAVDTPQDPMDVLDRSPGRVGSRLGLGWKKLP